MVTGANPRMVPEFLTGRLMPNNRLAVILSGKNNRPSTQTLIVRPVSSTTLSPDGKSENCKLSEGLFYTMI